MSDSTLHINLKNITHNYKYIASKSRTAKTAAVVKANAYGLGVEKVSKTLLKAGCEDFFVATLDEAIELRRYIKSANIYVFHGIKKSETKEFYQHKITPILNDVEQIILWEKFANNLGKKLACIINFDTGMNRLGINFEYAEDVKLYLENAKSLDVKYVMSHLACIGLKSHEMNNLQKKRIAEIKKIFPKNKITFANTGGSFSGKDFQYDLLRPGSGLYGIKGSFVNEDIKHVVSIKAKIIQLRDVENDGTIGYAATHEINAGSRIAVVPVGYADGYLRTLSNNSYGFFADKKVPLVGRVSMDMLIFDVSKIPANKIKLGDEIELIGDNFTVDEVAKKAGTIGYEILTNLGSRYKRIYTN
jgi:alanine racemase